MSNRFTRGLAGVALLISAATPVLAQSTSATSGGAAGSSPGSASGASTSSGPSATSTAPSGGSTSGHSAAGPETPTQRHEMEQMKKETTICKGC